MPQTEQFDAIIIGAGQGGNPMAKYLAGRGMRTAIIEERHLGGTCVNTGCTPTKTLIGSSNRAYAVKHADSLGIHVQDVKVNFQEIIARKDKMVMTSRENQQESLGKTENLEVIYGHAQFSEDKVLKIALNNDQGERTLQAEKIFIDTGTKTLIPPIDGLDQVKYYDNRTIMELDTLPEHLLVVGGGYIGLEFGQMFHRFGSKVSIFHSSSTILDIEDDDIAEEMTKILEEEGITIHTDSKVTAIRKEGGKIHLSTESGGVSEDYDCSHVLFAVGRKPNTENLGLENTGIKTDDKGYIQADDQLQTDVEGVYVIGDIKGGPQFTHTSYNDYLILKKNLFEEGNLKVSDRILTYTVFTDPQLGRAGLNEQTAKEQGIPYRVAKLPMSKVARAQEMGNMKGVMKVLVGKDDRILGASILGMEGGEIASALLIAMMGGLQYQQLRDATIAHPTLMEAMSNLFSSL